MTALALVLLYLAAGWAMCVKASNTPGFYDLADSGRGVRAIAYVIFCVLWLPLLVVHRLVRMFRD